MQWLITGIQDEHPRDTEVFKRLKLEKLLFGNEGIQRIKIVQVVLGGLASLCDYSLGGTGHDSVWPYLTRALNESACGPVVGSSRQPPQRA